MKLPKVDLKEEQPAREMLFYKNSIVTMAGLKKTLPKLTTVLTCSFCI